MLPETKPLARSLRLDVSDGRTCVAEAIRTDPECFRTPAEDWILTSCKCVEWWESTKYAIEFLGDLNRHAGVPAFCL